MATTPRARSDGPTSSLTRLLATEAELDALVAEARQRAELDVAAARARSQAAVDGLAAELAAAEAEHLRARDETVARRRREIEAETERAVRRHADLGEEEVGALASWLVDRVLEP